jgi:hypothetical protein
VGCYVCGLSELCHKCETDIYKRLLNLEHKLDIGMECVANNVKGSIQVENVLIKL